MTIKTLEVTAAPGVSVPLEDKPRKYITGETPVTVPATAYYLRRVADGDLVLVPQGEQSAAKKGGK